MTLKRKKTRRCDKKTETPEGNLLKYLRESRKLSMRKAADLIGTSSSTVNHVENGRKDITTGVILKFLDAYGYSFEQFQEMLKGNIVLPQHVRSECIDIVNRLDDQKLKTVKAFLSTFLGQLGELMGIKFDEKKNYYIVSYHRRHPVTREAKNISRRGIKTKAEAEKIYKDLIIKMGEKFNENMHPLWPEVVRRFLEYYANCGIAKNTLKNYKQCIEANTYSIWSKKRINEISTAEVRDFIQENMGKFSEAHRKSMLKHLRAVFRYAVEYDLIPRDPCPKLKFKKNEKIKKMLTEDEIKIFLSSAKQQSHEWFPVWALACYTGLRNGELYALKWENVDLKKRIIYITHSWNMINGYKETKSGDDRVVEIAPSLLPLLIELKETNQSDFVLPRIRDWETGTQAKPLKEFLKGLNLPLIRFHDLRASWATIMLSKGIEPIKVMSMGGWKDLKTMQIYIRKSGIHIQGITDNLSFL